MRARFRNFFAESLSRRLLLGIGAVCALFLFISFVEQQSSNIGLTQSARSDVQERARLIHQICAAEEEKIKVVLPDPTLPTQVKDGRGEGLEAVALFDGAGTLENFICHQYSRWGKYRPSLPKNVRKRVLESGITESAYVSTPAGLVQVFVAPRPGGKLIAALRPWDDALLSRFSRKAGVLTQIVGAGADVRSDASFESDRFRVTTVLRDWKGAPVALRHDSGNMPLTAQMRITILNHQALVAVSLIVILATIGVLLGVLVTGPLRRMRRAVLSGDLAILQPLMEDRSEIGQQARLIDSWFLLRNELLHTNEWLEREVRAQTHELEEAYTSTISALVSALEYRDQDTKGHCERVTSMAEMIARELGFVETEISNLRRGALLHDIGKIAIPDGILLKPGALSPLERQVMETHAEIGFTMLEDIRFLEPALDVLRYHHEKWDGTGYPLCARGEEIPLPARIFALVDVWDALSSQRPYRRAWSPTQVRAHILALEGTHFDPTVVAAFSKLPLDAFPTEWCPEELAA